MKNIPFFKNLPGKGSFVHNNFLIGVCIHFKTVDSKVLAALCVHVYSYLRILDIKFIEFTPPPFSPVSDSLSWLVGKATVCEEETTRVGCAGHSTKCPLLARAERV